MRSLRIRISELYFPRAFLGMVMIFLAFGCGESSDHADPTAWSTETFSASIPARIPTYLLSDLTAEVRVDGGPAISLTVDTANGRVQGTITDLAPGAHTVEIYFYVSGVLVATGSTTATVVSGQATQVSFDMFYYPDEDGDGWTNLAELEVGTAWNDAASRPPSEIPRSSANYVLSDVVGISPVIGASLSTNYEEEVGIPTLDGEEATSPNYTLHGH